MSTAAVLVLAFLIVVGMAIGIGTALFKIGGMVEVSRRHHQQNAGKRK